LVPEDSGQKLDVLAVPVTKIVKYKRKHFSGFI
jgi:hypothetical protein